MTQANVQAVMAEIRAHPDTKAFSAHEFIKGKCFYTTSRDTSDYHNYQPWKAGLTADEIADAFTYDPAGTGTKMPMTAIWLLFDTNAVTQTYRIEAVQRNYVRWPLDHVGSVLSRPVPTAEPGVLARLAQTGSVLGAAGHALEDAAEGAYNFARGGMRALQVASGYGRAAQMALGYARAPLAIGL
jgi:hypothetical protein